MSSSKIAQEIWYIFHHNIEQNIIITIREIVKIIKKMNNLTYHLELSQHWGIHFVISIAHLEFLSFSASNKSFSQSIFLNDNSAHVNSFEIEKVIIKRFTRRDVKYLVKWLKCESKKDVWRNLSKLDNVMKLIEKFESAYFETLTISRKRERLRSKFKNS